MVTPGPLSREARNREKSNALNQNPLPSRFIAEQYVIFVPEGAAEVHGLIPKREFQVLFRFSRMEAKETRAGDGQARQRRKPPFHRTHSSFIDIKQGPDNHF